MYCQEVGVEITRVVVTRVHVGWGRTCRGVTQSLVREAQRPLEGPVGESGEDNWE